MALQNKSLTQPGGVFVLEKYLSLEPRTYRASDVVGFGGVRLPADARIEDNRMEVAQPQSQMALHYAYA